MQISCLKARNIILYYYKSEILKNTLDTAYYNFASVFVHSAKNELIKRE